MKIARCNTCPLLKWNDERNHTECGMEYKVEFRVMGSAALYYSQNCGLIEIQTIHGEAGNYKPVYTEIVV